MLLLPSTIAITSLATAANAFAFVPHAAHNRKKETTTIVYGTKVGIFFGTSTGSTQEAADLIAAEFGTEVASSPIEIDEVQGSIADEFAKYDALVVGTPTWNTGADTERSGTGWDEVYYSEMNDLNIAGKKVAVFGLGDSVSYSENYADASGELHDVFESLGCVMLGYTSTEGYLHDESKAIRGDKFCGLLLDAVNQEELTEERVQNWVAGLIDEGILNSDGAAAPPAVVASSVETPAPAPQIEVDVSVVEPTAPAEKEEGFVGHYNSQTDSTWWVSANGRSSFVTSGPPEMQSTMTKTNTRLSP